MFANKESRAAKKAAKAQAALAAAEAEPKYEIICVKTGDVLQEVSGTVAAQEAQEDWHDLWFHEFGPRTTVRAKPTGIPHSRDTIDALILQEVPSHQREAYTRAMRLLITQRTPLEQLQWIAEAPST